MSDVGMCGKRIERPYASDEAIPVSNEKIRQVFVQLVVAILLAEQFQQLVPRVPQL